jgi:hypothetical protein
MPMAEIARIIALGASNLTRGFFTIVSTARSLWGPEVQVLAALGHGRSYGASSSIGIRALPGILESGLWAAVGALPPAPTRALVTDVGNDIVYGVSVDQTLEWVEKALDRLQRVTPDIVLTDLPLASIQRLSQAKYLLFRSILFPSSRLTRTEVQQKADRINAGLEELAAGRAIRFFRLDPAWYGFDPIHIRPKFWRTAWQSILGTDSFAGAGGRSFAEGLQLYFMPPERGRLFGVERFTPQSGRRLRRGGRIWLF